MIAITIARKPLSEKNIARNVLRWGTGALHIDATRIPVSDADRESIKKAGGWAKAGYVNQGSEIYGGGRGLQPEGTVVAEQAGYHQEGRWPANVLLSPEAAADVDEQSGEVPTGNWVQHGDGMHPFGDAEGSPSEEWKAVEEAPGGAAKFFRVIE